METSSISGTERQNQILLVVESRQRISVADICDQFMVSEATARRDLEMLAAQGKVQRVHGGAIALNQPPPEQPILQRQDEQAQEKVRIGQAAVSLVQEGSSSVQGQLSWKQPGRCVRAANLRSSPTLCRWLTPWPVQKA